MKLTAFLSALIISTTVCIPHAHALPGKKQFSIKKKDYSMYFIHNYTSLVVLKVYKANMWGSNSECGVFPIQGNNANIEGTTISFERNDYALFNGMRHFYDENKLDLVLYRDKCDFSVLRPKKEDKPKQR